MSTARQNGESADEYAERIADEQHDWLDELAERQPETAIDIAAKNVDSIGRWGATWLQKRGITEQNITAVKKYASALQAFDVGEAEFKKSNPGKSINDFIRTETGVELYREACSTRAELNAANQPGIHVTADQAAGKATAFDALEKGLVAFCKSKNITKNVWTEGLAKFRETDEGAALKAAYDETT